SPGDNAVVGVGMPISVKFNRSVPTSLRGEVERRLKVTTTPALKGAWHWMNSKEVHWRPPTYWPAHTKIVVTSNLGRLDAGDGVWGDSETHTSKFAIGDSHVSIADIASHQMTVTTNGKIVKVLPMSAGRDKFPTKGGVHIALEKSQIVTMDS